MSAVRVLVGTRKGAFILTSEGKRDTWNIAGPLGGGADARMITVVLPPHLRVLARVSGDVQIEVQGQVTQASVLDALENRYRLLRGTLRDQVTLKRRPFVRFFASGEDVSFEPPHAPLPEAVASGREPFFIVGALAGGETGGSGLARCTGVKRV